MLPDFHPGCLAWLHKNIVAIRTVKVVGELRLSGLCWLALICRVDVAGFDGAAAEGRCGAATLYG